MKNVYKTFLLLIFCQTFIYTQVDSSIIAFRNVNIIPMDSLHILNDYTVITINGSISKIGPSQSVTIPPLAYIIESDGKFLIPGLTDMHVHIDDQDYLMLFLANGVTTIRNMWGEPQHLAWRKSIREEILLGPELYTTGPILEGADFQFWPGSKIIGTVNQARNIVRENKKDGYDFIKIYTSLFKKEIVDAIMDEAAKQNIRVVGHPPCITDNMWNVLEYSYKSGIYSIEHMDWYLMALWQIPFDLNLPTWLWKSYYSEETDSLLTHQLAKLQLQAGTWSCPTLVVLNNLVSPEEYQQAMQRPYMKYVKNSFKEYWRNQINNSKWSLDFLKEYRKNIANKKIIKTMYDEGVKLLIGTDCQNPLVVWGFSAHEEMRLFVEAGLTPFEVLQIATKNAAEFMNAENIFGTVREGLRADLILLNSNPLDDISNLEDRVGVMVRGRWLPQKYLNDKLDPSIIAPSAIIFDSITAGNSSAKYLSIYNDGLCELIIDSVYINSKVFKIDYYSKKVQAKSYGAVKITFTPAEAGELTGLCTIKSNDKNKPTYNISLQGFCVTDIRAFYSQNITHYSLSQNFPNPFNPTTKIKYSIPVNIKQQNINVKLAVYDISGRRIAVLVNKVQKPGYYEVYWNAEGFSSGVYFYKLISGNYIETKKMLLLK